MIYHIMEYCSNQTLMHYIKHSGVFKEEFVQFYFKQIAHAVAHIHDKDYAHLDIKLNNIFLDDYFNIRIGDFGSALKLSHKRTKSRRGTPNYMAPEVKDLVKGRTFNAKQADVYSAGVCLYVLLFKSFPKLPEGTTKLTETDPDSNPFENSKWFSRSKFCRHLLLKMLQTDPKKRFNDMGEVFNHDWLLDESAPESEKLLTYVYNEMVRRRSRIEANSAFSRGQARIDPIDP